MLMVSVFAVLIYGEAEEMVMVLAGVMDFVVKFQGREVPTLRGLVKAAARLKVSIWLVLLGRELVASMMKEVKLEVPMMALLQFPLQDAAELV